MDSDQLVVNKELSLLICRATKRPSSVIPCHSWNPLGRSWRHFLGNHRQKMINLQKSTFYWGSTGLAWRGWALGFRIQGWGFTVQSAGCRVDGSGFMVAGLQFSVFRVEGLRFKEWARAQADPGTSIFLPKISGAKSRWLPEIFSKWIRSRC